FGLHAEVAAEVESFAGKIVVAGEADFGAGDAEAEAREGGEVAREMEGADQIGDGAAGVFIVGLAESVAAEGFELVADFDAGELCVADAEIAVEGEAVNDFFFARSKKHFRSEIDGAGHDGLGRFGSETKNVLEAGVGGIDVEGDDVALLPGGADDAAVGDDEGVEEGGADGMEIRVAIGAVHRGRKFRVQRNGTTNRVERKIRRV